MLMSVNELLTRVVLIFEETARAVCASAVTLVNALFPGVIPFPGFGVS